MRIKLDENLPSRLASRLGDLGHDVQTVGEEGIAGKVDSMIWEAAQREARFVITQDMVSPWSYTLHRNGIVPEGSLQNLGGGARLRV